MTLQKLFLTFGGAGLSPKQPDTAGTLAALPVGIAILYYFGMETLFMLTLFVSIVGIFEINRYEKRTGIHDDKQIVIDEVAGIWIAMMFALSVSKSMSYPYANEIAIALSFATFRLFDIWKPSTIGFIDRKVSGGLGVMGDDILAGIAGGFLSIVILMGLDKLFML